MGETGPLAGLGWEDSTPEAICAAVATIFRVRKTEVALLQLCGTLLKFLYPDELKTAGVIPLSSSALAARTARTKRADLSNNFTEVKHSSVFEVVKLGGTESDTDVIQKIMSAPVVAENGKVLGVIQISRKAHRQAAAGPDFTADDLQELKSVATEVAGVMARNQA